MISSRTHRIFTFASAVLISVLVFSPVVPVVQASSAAGTNYESELLQFTSQGYVLGFSEDGVIVASARHMLKVEFLGSKSVAPKANNTTLNNDKAQSLGRVTYQNVWDGVTVEYEANKSSVVKSTYYLDDGAYTSRIRLGYNRPVQLDEQGNLVIRYENGTMTESAPIAWQEIEGERKPVAVAYALYAEQEVGFSLSDYIPGIPVVIDPDLTWNTFLGGSGTDTTRGIAVDANGSVYVTGISTATWGAPVRAYTLGNDIYAAKLDSSGNLIWNTFLGDIGNDQGNAIVIDGNGNVYISASSDVTWGSPVQAYTSGFDGVAVKLASNGALTWNTFLGASGTDSGQSIAVDSGGNVYVIGQSDATWGTPIRAYTLGQDIYVAELSSNGALTWNTFLGGSGTDGGADLALDSSGNVYAVGNSSATWGAPVRAYTAGTDGYVTKLDNNGALTWNTFLGGSGTDTVTGVAVDGSGNAYVSGNTAATWGAPVRAYTLGNDIYAAKLDSSGTLTWNTFLGGSGNDTASEVAVDGSGNVSISASSDVTWGTPVRAYTAGTDSFAAQLTNNGALTWNTFLGGGGSDSSGEIGVDGSGNVYVAGNSSATWGTPVRAYTLGTDAFVAKLLADRAFGGSQNAIIHISTSANPSSLPSGPGPVTYTYTVANPGSVTLSDVTVVDDQCSNVVYVSGDSDMNARLETSETWIYTCTVILTKTTISFSTARGFAGGLVVSDTAVTEVFVGNPPPPTTAPTSTTPTPPPTPTPTSTPAIPQELLNALVKLPDDGNSSTQFDSAVYYIGTDGKRHAFPNDKVYFTWYTSFNGVQIMSTDQLASIPLGQNVTYKPGVKMVKFTTDPKVYAVAKNGVLRWIASESVAISLYGSNWNQNIDDISDAFFSNYQFGTNINSTSDYNPALEQASVSFPSDSLQI